MTYSLVIPTLWKSNLDKFYDTLQNFCEDDIVKEIIYLYKYDIYSCYCIFISNNI